MNIDPAEIRARIDELLDDMPDPTDPDVDLERIESIAARLEEAHQLLVRALESVQR